MPHFVLSFHEDGRIDEVLRDGEPFADAVRLEQLYDIVTAYFQGAAANLEDMGRVESHGERRRFGLQSFILSLTAIEAFTNVYFHLRGTELSDNEIVSRIRQTHGSLTNKISALLSRCGDGTLTDQDGLLNKILDLTQLRNDLVHPRWAPSSLSLDGIIHVHGLVENRQALLENVEFCRYALMLGILFVARVAEMRNISIEAFVGRWTGLRGLEMSEILRDASIHR